MTIPDLRLLDRRRFVGLLALGAAGVVIAASYFTHPAATSDSTPPSPPSRPAATSTPSGIPTRLVSPREAATEATRLYVAAFFDKSGTERHWHASIDAHSTATLASLNATVPRAEVPDAHLRSLRVTGIKTTYAELEARMSDGMVLFVAAVLDAGEWRVNEFAPIAPVQS